MNRERKEIHIRKGLERRLKGRSSETRSSFLVEIEYNHDIKAKVRNDIEEKYKKSQINALYVFPRVKDFEEVNLPAIRGDRKYALHNETVNHLSNLGIGNSSVNSSINVNNPKKNYRISPILKNPKNYPHSFTPSPFLSNISQHDHLKEIKRNTPTPLSEFKKTLVPPNKNLL